jgi:hypothetical protein
VETQTIAPREAQRPRSVPWGTRIFAALGFLLALGAVVLGITRQLAIQAAQSYLRDRYHADVEAQVRSVRPEILAQSGTENPLPPLGFCWSVDLQVGTSHAKVSIDPWTREVVDWSAEL